MPTEESLKRELARLRKEKTALFKQAVQDATSWQRMDTIGRRTINVLNQLTEHFPGWKDDSDGIQQFGLVADVVEKANPDLVVRDADGKSNTLRYEAVSSMLHNQFLKEHCKGEEQGATIIQLKATVAHQQKQIEVLTATLKEQAPQNQRVRDPLELRVSDPLEVSKPAPQLVADNQ
jgi:hypothetical protein